jgi:transcriptional antiterminator RfaH
MPLLPLEPFVFPDDLLSSPGSCLETSDRWWVLHTRPRCEKALARKCMQGRIPFFLPLYRHHWSTGGRRFCSHMPLFPGYVFLYGDGDARLAALTTNLVAHILPVADQDQLHADLIRVYQMVTSGVSLAAEQRLQPGQRVEIVEGPLTGLEGTIVRQGARCRFVVEVQFLKAGVSVELEGWMVRPRECGEPMGVPAAAACG